MFNLQTYEWELHVCWYLLTCDTAGPELLSLQHFSTFICDGELNLSSSEPSKSTVTDLLLHWWQSQDIKRWLPSSICHQFHVSWLSDGGIKPLLSFSEKRIRQRKRRITVTQVPLTPPSVQIYSITLESWTWEWNMTNKIMFPTSSRSDEQTFYCNSRKAETLPGPGSTAGIQS